VLVRTDSGGGTHEFLDYLTARHLQYSVGFGLTEITAAAVDLIPADGMGRGLRRRRGNA
jgi:hypothetical protein